jgi:BolA family transcriptional regulator, general stress-responsive regulator
MLEYIEEIIKKKLKIKNIKIIDNSYLHKNHKGNNGSEYSHIKIEIISDDFKGKSHIERHRMIQDILKNEFSQGLHSLEIKAKTSTE